VGPTASFGRRGEEKILDRTGNPDRAQSLYRLSYPGSSCKFVRADYDMELPILNTTATVGTTQSVSIPQYHTCPKMGNNPRQHQNFFLIPFFICNLQLHEALCFIYIRMSSSLFASSQLDKLFTLHRRMAD
jgi:hypothetical protein